MYMLAGSVPRDNVDDYFYTVKVAITEFHIHELYKHFKTGTLSQFLDKEILGDI